MLSKVFLAVDTPRGTFLSGMATILDRSSEEEEGMYLIYLYKGEDLQWPFRVSSQKAIAIPLAYHGVTYDDSSEGGWQKYHSRCFHILLQVSKDDAVILPSQLTGIPYLVKAEFKTRWQYGSCCMLFRSSEPSHLIPLGMTSIAVPGLLEPWSQAFSACTTAVAGGFQQSAVSSASASESQASDHSTVRRMFSSTRDSLDQATVSSAVPKSPGIPVDFEVQQPKSRSAKKRRISGGQGGGQTAVDPAGPAVALSHVRKWVMDYVGDRIAFNRISEEYCQTERLHMLEVVAMANKAHTQVLKDFPDILTGSSTTVALVCTLAKACEKHTAAILEGIETSHENWMQLMIQWANAES